MTSPAIFNTGEAVGDVYSNIDGLIGSGFSDTLKGGALADDLFGGAGFDTMSGGTQADELHGEAGDDTLSGDDGTDILNGGVGNDVLKGGLDADHLNGGAGADKLDGGGGDDVASYLSSSAGIKVNFGDTALSTGDAKGDSYTSVEVLWGSAFADTVIGADSDDSFAGFGGNDFVVRRQGRRHL